MRRPSLTVAALVAATLCTSAAALRQGDRPVDAQERTAGVEEIEAYLRAPSASEVRVEGEPGSETLTIDARFADLDAVVRQVANASGREARGLEVLSRHPEITAQLRGQDLRDAMRWIGLSVGMRITVTTSEIRVAEDLSPYPTRADLFARASAGYSMALRDHPESDHAPKAAWNRARIESELPGRELEAARAFDEITERYPKSDLVPGALLEAGRLFGRAGVWNEAMARFDTLAGFPREHGHSVTARRLLADAYTRIAEAATNPVVAEENARRALLVLDALDDIDPTRDLDERRMRSLVRSRAASLVGDPVAALRALDIAEKYSERGPSDPEIVRLRAGAFERAERYDDAVRAWLRHASLVEGADRQHALERAAEVSNRGGFPLAAIAVHRLADKSGMGESVQRHADAAYAALDLVPPRVDLFGDEERLTRGESLVTKGMHDEAIDALRPLFDRRSTLGRDDHRRLAFAYAEALAARNRVDEAILALRLAAGEMTRGMDRRDVYLFASRLLEDAGEIDRAIAALEGRL